LVADDPTQSTDTNDRFRHLHRLSEERRRWERA
jgi:hypothetical protein